MTTEQRPERLERENRWTRPRRMTDRQMARLDIVLGCTLALLALAHFCLGLPLATQKPFPSWTTGLLWLLTAIVVLAHGAEELRPQLRRASRLLRLVVLFGVVVFVVFVFALSSG